LNGPFIRLRTAALRVFGTALINTGELAIANLVQEFVLRRLTPKAQNEK
jgi:hypothetical protein